jgi:hypothetical protein
MTIKRHPRTSMDAFPKSCDYACPLTRFDRSPWHGISKDEWVALAALVALLFAAPFIWPALMALIA